MLYEAFGWDCPLFAHLPLLLKPDGNGKLSKRDGDRLGFPVFPTNWTTTEGELYSGYREKGYLPGAFINMLALLGWNPGTPQEIFSLDELVEAFSLERVSKSGAKFDPNKTTWFQQHYLREQTNEELADELRELFPSLTQSNQDLAIICGLMKERATFVQDIHIDGHYLFERPSEIDSDSISKKWKGDTSALLHGWKDKLSHLELFDAITIEKEFKIYLEENAVSIGAVLLPFRLVVTGVGAGPGMFDISAYLGQKEVVERMQIGLEIIQKQLQ
jgi:glutamyl-tRNA synthetase